MRMEVRGEGVSLRPWRAGRPPTRSPVTDAIILHCVAPGFIFTDLLNLTRHWAEPFIHFVLFTPHPSPGRVLPISQVGQLGLSEVSALALTEPHSPRGAEPWL